MAGSILDIRIMIGADMGQSIREMKAEYDTAGYSVSTYTIQHRIEALLAQGLLREPPRTPGGKRAARSLRMTDKGKMYLKENGYQK